MLPSGRSFVEQIFACDEEVMGFHNDQRAGGKMPAIDRLEINCFISLIYFFAFVSKISKRLSDYKITFCLVYLGRFSTCFSVMYINMSKSGQAIRPWRQHLLLNNLFFPRHKDKHHRIHFKRYSHKIKRPKPRASDEQPEQTQE